MTFITELFDSDKADRKGPEICMVALPSASASFASVAG